MDALQAKQDDAEANDAEVNQERLDKAVLIGEAYLPKLKAFMKHPTLEGMTDFGQGYGMKMPHCYVQKSTRYVSAIKWVTDYPSDKIPLTVVQYTRLTNEGQVPG